MNLKESLFNILCNKSCFLCFNTSPEMIHQFEEFEIKCEYFGVQINISEIFKCLFPSYDMFQSQSCKNCSDLLIQIYILLEKQKQVENILSNTINNIFQKLKDYLRTPQIKSPLVLNLISNTKQNVIINTEANVNKNVSSCLKTNKSDIVFKEYLSSNDNTNSINLEPTVMKKNSLLLNVICNTEQNFKTESNLNKIGSVCQKLKSKSIEIETRKRIRKKVYYNCSLCSYKTLCKAVLDGHMNKKHLNIRPFVCNTCYKGFYRKSNLVEHIQSHENNKELCELCGDVFRQKRSLKDHLRLHSDDRQYECNVCGKKFITSGRRSDHMKRSHMRKTETCLFCSKQFGLKKELTRHMKSVHTKI